MLRMDKRHLRYVHRLVKNVRFSYLVVALLISLTTFVFAYRSNNLTAIRLRNELLEVDKQNGDVAGALNRLRLYTYAHMNADLSAGSTGIYPPIQLKYTYERLVSAEQKRATDANGQLYTQAQAYCEQQVTSRVTINRVPCIQSYLESHGAVAANAIPDALYKFDFVSPRWSPDLAGWSLVVSIFLTITLATRIGLEYWFRRRLG